MIAGRTRHLGISETKPRPKLPDLWYQIAIVSLTFALVDGYGAYDLLFALTPMKYVGLQMMMLTATLLVCPRGSTQRVFVPIPALCFIGWWVVSYLWATDRAGWVSATARDLATVVSIVVLAQVVGVTAFIKTLLRSGYICIGLIFVALAVQPGLAYDVAGPAPGLHGGFIHKNAMGPCLLVTTAAVLCFHPDKRFRRGFVVFVGALMFLGQTTTGLATLVALVLLSAVLGNYVKVVDRLGRASGALMVGSTLVFSIVAAQSFGSAVRLSGKDLTFSSRTVIWEGVSTAISARPWTGYGYGVWQHIWLNPIRAINLHNGFLVAEAHNAALDLMLRLGIVGLVLYLLQLIGTVRIGWKGLLVGRPLGHLTLLYCAILVLVGFSESLTAFGVWPALLFVFGTISRTSKPADRMRVGARRAAVAGSHAGAAP